MNTRRRILSLLSALLLSAALAAPTASALTVTPEYSAAVAAENAGQTLWTGEFPLNYSSLFPRSLLLEGNTVILRGIPDEDDSRFLLLTLTPDGERKDTYRAAVERNDAGEAVFSLTSLPDGLYRLDLYHNNQLYQAYSHLLDLTVRNSGGAWAIVNSPVYARNAALSKRESATEAALAFYLRATPDIQSEDPKIQAEAARITGGLSDNYEKALAIHDWVCNTLYYDYDVFYDRADYGDNSAKGAYTAKRGVCEGFANLTCALLRASGVPAKKVNGYVPGISGSDDFTQAVLDGSGTSNHTWTEAYADGRWIIIDTTWDTGNDYAGGRITVSGGCESHRYFDISQECFSLDHAALEAPSYGQIRLYVNYTKMWARGAWQDLTNNGVTVFRKDGWVMAPIGTLVEEMGGTSEWYREAGFLDRLTCRIGGHHVQLWPYWKEFYVDGNRLVFDVAPQVVNGYTVVQVAPLFNALGFSATSDGVQDNWQDGRVTLTYAA